MMFLMAALFVGPYLLLVSDAIPAFDVKQSCRGAETTGMAGRTIQMCIDSERATRDQLKKSWSEFNADDKTLCMKMIKSGVPPSYAELVSCLETKRDIRRIHAMTPAPNESSAITSSRRR
jgi:hypothetical protein